MLPTNSKSPAIAFVYDCRVRQLKELGNNGKLKTFLHFTCASRINGLQFA
jgi:hypothetical protein